MRARRRAGATRRPWSRPHARFVSSSGARLHSSNRHAGTVAFFWSDRGGADLVVCAQLRGRFGFELAVGFISGYGRADLTSCDEWLGLFVVNGVVETSAA